MFAGAVEDSGAVAWVGFQATGEQRLGHLGLQAPSLPHAHRAPSGSTTTWPISPAARTWTRRQLPIEDEPGADALVDPDADQVARRPLAERQLGEGRGLASLMTATGRANSAPGVSASGTSSQPRWAAVTTTPAASTMPGLAMPMPSMGGRH